MTHKSHDSSHHKKHKKHHKKKQHRFHPEDNRADRKLVEITERTGFKMAVFSMAAMTVLGNTIIAPSLPAITEHFAGVRGIDVLARLVLTIPALFVVFLSTFAGYLMDKYGRIKFVYPAMVVWTLAGVSGYFMDNIYAILASRSVFGMATAFIMTGASALLGDYYSRGGFNRRESALSLQGFFCAIGGAVFISLGGYVSSFSWRYPFLVYASGILILIFAMFYLFEPKLRRDDPEADAKFRYRDYALVYFMSFFVMFVYFIVPTQVPYYIVDHLGLNSKLVGISMSVSALAYGVFSLAYKDLARYLSYSAFYKIALIAMGASFLSLFFFHSFAMVIIALAALGGTGGILLVNNSSLLFARCPAKARGKAYGFMASCLFFGQFVSPLLTQPLVSSIGLIEMFLLLAIILFVVAGGFFIARPIRQ